MPPTLDLQDTSYVVISRETERFVNEIHDHKEEVRSSDELLGDLQESERKVTTSCNETWAALSTRKLDAGSLSLIPKKASLYTRRIIPTNEKKVDCYPGQYFASKVYHSANLRRGDYNVSSF